MMNTRKLQGEIDRTLKKIQDGISEFEATFHKIRTAPSTNQKEKHENDLKKEIKKLQRLREQVKIWVSQNDVKNKTPLIEARKKIETEMERYKNYERESKTKDYSNAGLKLRKSGMSSKAANDATTEWINSTIDELLSQAKGLDEEIKTLESKDVENIDPDELEEDAMKIASLDERKERHKEHVENLKKAISKWHLRKISPDRMEHIQRVLESYLQERTECAEGDESAPAVLYADLSLDAVDEEIIDDSVSETGTLSDDGSINFDDDYSMEKNSPGWGSLNLLPSTDSAGDLSEYASDLDNFHGSETSSVNDYSDENSLRGSQQSIKNEDSVHPQQEARQVLTSHALKQDSYAHVVVGSTRPNTSEPPPPKINTQEHPSFVSTHPQAPTSPPTLSSVLFQGMRFLPEINDTPRPSRPYKPRNPYNVPASFPSGPLPHFEDPAFFEKFDLDVLFFIFYYQQGTYQQYLAAKELKRRDWRYHKKYLTWFQRHEGPKEVTADYERGTYVYFDYEHTGWCQRKKTEFTFEYRFLEDLQ